MGAQHSLASTLGRDGLVGRARAWWRGVLVAIGSLVAVAIPVAASAESTASQYQQVNLVSDIAGVARVTDPQPRQPMCVSPDARSSSRAGASWALPETTASGSTVSQRSVAPG